MRDKDVDEILAPLLPLTSRVIATSAPTPRALPADELAARVRAAAERLGLSASLSVEVDDDPLHAVDRALASARLACVAGSIFLVGRRARAPPGARRRARPAAGMTIRTGAVFALAVVLATAAADGQQLQPPASQQPAAPAPGGAPPAARSLRSPRASPAR